MTRSSATAPSWKTTRTNIGCSQRLEAVNKCRVECTEYMRQRCVRGSSIRGTGVLDRLELVKIKRGVYSWGPHEAGIRHTLTMMICCQPRCGTRRKNKGRAESSMPFPRCEMSRSKSRLIVYEIAPDQSICQQSMKLTVNQVAEPIPREATLETPITPDKGQLFRRETQCT